MDICASHFQIETRLSLIMSSDLIWFGEKAKVQIVSCSSGVRRGATHGRTKGMDGDLDRDNRRTVFGWKAEAHLLWEFWCERLEFKLRELVSCGRSLVYCTCIPMLFLDPRIILMVNLQLHLTCLTWEIGASCQWQWFSTSKDPQCPQQYSKVF